MNYFDIFDWTIFELPYFVTQIFLSVCLQKECIYYAAGITPKSHHRSLRDYEWHQIDMLYSERQFWKQKIYWFLCWYALKNRLKIVITISELFLETDRLTVEFGCSLRTIFTYLIMISFSLNLNPAAYILILYSKKYPRAQSHHDSFILMKYTY